MRMQKWRETRQKGVKGRGGFVGKLLRLHKMTEAAERWRGWRSGSILVTE